MSPDFFEPSISPVLTTSLSFSYRGGTDTTIYERLPALSLCPGSILTVAELRPFRRFRFDLVRPLSPLPQARSLAVSTGR